MLSPSGDELAPSGEGYGGIVAPSGTILGASGGNFGGNGVGRAAGATSS